MSASSLHLTRSAALLALALAGCTGFLSSMREWQAAFIAARLPP